MSTIENQKQSDFIKYLIEVAKKNLELAADDKKNIYDIQIKFLENLSLNEYSILYKVINDIQPTKIDFDEADLIFPFTYNISQKIAICKAFSSDMSLIQGPPGTGKTQTIINIIANMLYQSKKVAIVSANNYAVENVLIKLKEVNLDFLAALHGNSDKIKDFFKPENKIPIPKDSYSWKAYEVADYHARLQTNLGTTSILLAKQQEVFKLKQEIIEWDAELQSFKQQIRNIDENIIPSRFKNKLSFEKLLKLRKKLATWRLKDKHSLIAQYFFKRKFSKSATQTYINSITNFFDKKYYEFKINDLKAKICANEDFIKKNDFKALIEESSELSKGLLYGKIGDRYAGQTNLDGFTVFNYKKQYKKFLQRYPVILSTTNSIANASSSYLFDYVIMDEASQIDLVTASIALSCARNAVFVGDLNQLPHVVPKTNEIKKLFKPWEKILPSYFEYSSYNILKCLSTLYAEKIEQTLLNEHYRCDPYIINFCNKQFYDNELIVMKDHKPGNGIFYSYEDGEGKNEDKINHWEAELSIKCLLDLLNKKERSIGIIAPFKKQVDLISNKKEKVLENIKLAEPIGVSTVHRFQGREKDNIIISTVKEELIIGENFKDFLNDPHLLNVAISRAKHRVHFISNINLLKQKNTIYNDLYKYLMYYNGDPKLDNTKYRTLKIFSTFQLLHDADHPEWRDFYKNEKTPSKYLSENIVATELDHILKTKYKRCDFILNYPLKRIVNAELVEEKYRSFINCDKTHCDFIIFDKMDKSIKAAIEVDGKTHSSDYKQIQRDKKKNEILAHARIPLLRIPTYSSTYQEKMDEFIKKALPNFLNKL